ncbi:type VII secretion system-associated protein [Streptomyces sp. NPDC004009]
MPTSDGGRPDGVRGPVPADGAGPASPAARPPRTVAWGGPDLPAPPEDIVAAARTAPDHWLSVTGWHWPGEPDEGPVPPWAVLDRWRTDRHGEIVEWEANPDCRPSPAALGWGPPVSGADAAVHLAATGYGPDEDVAEALAEPGSVAVCVERIVAAVALADDPVGDRPRRGPPAELTRCPSSRSRRGPWPTVCPPRGDDDSRPPQPVAAWQGRAVPPLLRPGGPARPGGRVAGAVGGDGGRTRTGRPALTTGRPRTY